MKAQRLKLEKLLEPLRSLDWRGRGIRWSLLFGSLARLGEGRDADILVEPLGEWSYESTLEAALRVSEALGVEEDLVDIVAVSEAPLLGDPGTPGGTESSYTRRIGEPY